MTRNFVGARGIEAIFTTTTSGTTTAFPLYDCHGNMVATVSRSGAGFVTSNVRTYDVWGGVRTGASTGGPKGRYVANLGHVQDDESGLIYMRARFYEPESGRSISEDPAMDGSNWYVYADNNPVTNIDFSGKSKFSAAASIFLVTALLTFAINAFVSDIILNSVISGLVAVVGGTVIGACIKIVSQVINRLIMNAIAAYILAPYALLDSPTTAAAEKSLGGPAILAISRHIAMISALLLCIAIDEIM